MTLILFACKNVIAVFRRECVCSEIMKIAIRLFYRLRILTELDIFPNFKCFSAFNKVMLPSTVVMPVYSQDNEFVDEYHND